MARVEKYEFLHAFKSMWMASSMYWELYVLIELLDMLDKLDEEEELGMLDVKLGELKNIYLN